MSRLRRLVLSDRFFLLSCRVLPTRRKRTVREYHEKVEYLHLNPVKAGLVQRPEDWKWSSVLDYTGTVQAPAGAGSPIPVDRIRLPADPRTRI